MPKGTLKWVCLIAFIIHCMFAAIALLAAILKKSFYFGYMTVCPGISAATAWYILYYMEKRNGN